MMVIRFHLVRDADIPALFPLIRAYYELDGIAFDAIAIRRGLAQLAVDPALGGAWLIMKADRAVAVIVQDRPDADASRDFSVASAHARLARSVDPRTVSALPVLDPPAPTPTSRPRPAVRSLPVRQSRYGSREQCSAASARP
jgi:hypothetical protein